MIGQIEHHPLEPFLPDNTKLLMLGSFPPKKERWRMNFYYPNFQNDMWRILGICFYDNKDYFLTAQKNQFDVYKLRLFLIQSGIGISDVAESVIRHKDNASDNFLEIVKPRIIVDVLDQINNCEAIVTTGKKATEILIDELGLKEPSLGHFTQFEFKKKVFRLYRMPSSSRAYPKSLYDKAQIYKQMFIDLGMIL